MDAGVLSRRDICRNLAERLIIEYTGSLPPGQVLATVIRAGRVLGTVDLDAANWAGLCESMVRRGLADRLALAGS